MAAIFVKRPLFTILLTLASGLIVACSQAQPTPVPTATPTQRGASVTPTGKHYSAPPPMTIDPTKTITATMVTTKGTMVFQLFPKEAPKTVNNFVFLSKDSFYNSVIFHRIIKGFMVQSGDPTGTGAGSPGYSFPDEPVTRQYVRGTLAMANAGPNTNGSQFFIVHQDTPLPPNYTIFGILTQGFDVLDAIAGVPVTSSASGELSKPVQSPSIIRIDISEG